jgi:hypothetical protein
MQRAAQAAALGSQIFISVYGVDVQTARQIQSDEYQVMLLSSIRSDKWATP